MFVHTVIPVTVLWKTCFELLSFLCLLCSMNSNRLMQWIVLQTFCYQIFLKLVCKIQTCGFETLQWHIWNCTINSFYEYKYKNSVWSWSWVCTVFSVYSCSYTIFAMAKIRRIGHDLQIPFFSCCCSSCCCWISSVTRGVNKLPHAQYTLYTLIFLHILDPL